VGTYFYRTPEKNTQFNDEKVDVYSLGIILFEMWCRFQSSHERVKLLMQLRQVNKFPKKFEECHPRSAALIKWLLDPDPQKRPTVIQILQNELIPPKLEDEYIQEALKIITNSSYDSIHYRKLIEALFKNKTTYSINRNTIVNSFEMFIPKSYENCTFYK
jgi:translation initiation factor 2-alpha kinase 4